MKRHGLKPPNRPLAAPPPMPTGFIAAIGPASTRSISPITTRSGASRMGRSRPVRKARRSMAFRPGWPGSRSCASAPPSAPPSTASTSKGGALRRAKGRRAARRPGHRTAPGQDRGDNRPGAGDARPARAGRVGEASLELRRWPADRRHAQVDARGPGRNRSLASDLEGPKGARRALRRADDRLRLHAGDRHGQ